MANEGQKRIQLLRNTGIFNNLDDILIQWGVRETDAISHTRKTAFLSTLKDGEQILGRYKSNKVIEGEYKLQKYHTVYGISHIFKLDNGEVDTINSYIDVFYNKNEFNPQYEYGNGINVNNGIIETNLTTNGGLKYDGDAEHNKGSLSIQLKEENSIKIDEQGNLVYNIIENADTDSSDDKYVSKITQSSDGKIKITHKLFPISKIIAGDGIKVEGGAEKIVSVLLHNENSGLSFKTNTDNTGKGIKVNDGDQSIKIDSDGVKVNIVDCGNF